ncbi:MAG: CpsB/CapC family capsule biosynthesis tyrosine phosphatase [Bacteroidota bacterium]
MGFLGNIFGNKNAPLHDLSFMEADMHSHLIPGIDDGSPTMEDTLILLKKLQDLGLRKVITTPHVQSDVYRNTADTIKKGLEEVRAAVNADPELNIEVEAAAEYMVDYDFEKYIQKEELMCFGKQKFILLECPFFTPPENLNSVLFELRIAGYRPVLAHAERYPYWHHSMEIYEDLKDREIYLQVNLVSLNNMYGDATRKIAEKLIKNNFIDFAGTDLHNLLYYDNLLASFKNPWLRKLAESGKLMNPQL